MKFRLASLLAALAIAAPAGSAFAKEYTAAPPQKDAPPLVQRFPDIDKAKYAAPAWSGKVARDIANKKHDFRTRARDALKYARENPAEGVNFAGKYIIFSYGCGTGCISFNVIDAANGKIFDGLCITGYPIEDSWVNWGLKHDKSSTLLYVQGALDEGTDSVNVSGSGSFVFTFKDGKFHLLEHSPVVGIEE